MREQDSLPDKSVTTNLTGAIANTAREKRIAAQHAFKPAPPGAESPRAVYLDACRRVAQHLAAAGFRYAKSGPHATRVVGEWTDVISFSSSFHNVAAIQISLDAAVMLKNRRLARWRRRHASPRLSATVLAGHIGLLHSPTQWITWNLADPSARDAVIADVVREIREVGLPFLNRMKDVDAVAEAALARTLATLSLLDVVELLLAHRDPHHAAQFVRDYLRRHPQFAADFTDQLDRMRREGLPRWIPSRYAEALAYATIHYHLPVNL
jgi:hypothetical protein